MIAFGSVINDPGLYERCAAPGLRLAAEPDSTILPLGSSGLGQASIFRNYNLLLEQAAELDDLEAMVIVHQDAEIVDPDFTEKLRKALADPDVGVVGCAGAVGVRNIAWWDGSVTAGSFLHRYQEFGGGEIKGATWDREDAYPFTRMGEVDTIDGFMMALSPWAVRNLRFDESLGQFHGYDFDFCQQVRAAGKKVLTVHLRVIHHHSLNLITDLDGWMAAHRRIAEKWDGEMLPAAALPGDWKRRARWAEARCDAAMMKVNQADHVREAALSEARQELEDLRKDLESVATSASWRLTLPLRRLKRLFAGR